MNENNNQEENDIEEIMYDWYDYYDFEQNLNTFGNTNNQNDTSINTENLEFRITFENIIPNNTYNYYRPLQRRRLNSPISHENENLTGNLNNLRSDYPLLDRTLSSRINSYPIQFSPLRNQQNNRNNQNTSFGYTIEYDFSQIPNISGDRINRIRTLFNNYFQENSFDRVINESFRNTEFLTKNDNLEISQKFEFYKNIDNKIQQEHQTCIICSDNFEQDSKIQLLNCKHIYHHDCLTEWVKRTRLIEKPC